MKDGPDRKRIFYVALGLVALGGAGFLLLAGRGGGEAGPRPLPAWAAEVEADPAAGVTMGPEDAPAVIEEFADYQCPHCAQFGTFSGRLIRQNYVEGGGPARYVLYDYLVGFQNTIPAALAARCAGDQGRFWEMHDLVLSRQNEWGPSDAPRRHLRNYASSLGLDTGEFRACMDDRRHLEDVLASHQHGVERGVQGTPTLFFNGRRLDLSTESGYESLERLIRQAVDSARAATEAP